MGRGQPSDGDNDHPGYWWCQTCLQDCILSSVGNVFCTHFSLLVYNSVTIHSISGNIKRHGYTTIFWTLL